MTQLAVFILLALTMCNGVHPWSIQQLTMMSVERVHQKQGTTEDSVLKKTAVEADEDNGETSIDGLDQRFDVDGPQLTGAYDSDRHGHSGHHRITSDANSLPISLLHRLSPKKKHERKDAREFDIFSGDYDENNEGDRVDDEDDEVGQVQRDWPRNLQPGGMHTPSLFDDDGDSGDEQDAGPLHPFAFLQADDDGITLPLKSRELKRDWCFAAVVEQKIEQAGCVSVYVKNRMCYGQCMSFFVPRNDHGDFESCSYCTPTKARVEIVTLTCPGQANRVKKVDIIEECGCRPCGHNYI
ncbi:uncharacterized protein [Ptychodera flava]|uniref:uncharacterized protein n=1 Tax=Ptychodera flava TaxID=63121 RepID=UPI00396A5C48